MSQYEIYRKLGKRALSVNQDFFGSGVFSLEKNILSSEERLFLLSVRFLKMRNHCHSEQRAEVRGEAQMPEKG
jgi:hypothetical protein